MRQKKWNIEARDAGNCGPKSLLTGKTSFIFRILSVLSIFTNFFQNWNTFSSIHFTLFYQFFHDFPFFPDFSKESLSFSQLCLHRNNSTTNSRNLDFFKSLPNQNFVFLWSNEKQSRKGPKSSLKRKLFRVALMLWLQYVKKSFDHLCSLANFSTICFSTSWEKILKRTNTWRIFLAKRTQKIWEHQQINWTHSDKFF